MIDVHLISSGPVTVRAVNGVVESPTLSFKVVFVEPSRFNVAAPVILSTKVICGALSVCVVAGLVPKVTALLYFCDVVVSTLPQLRVTAPAVSREESWLMFPAKVIVPVPPLLFELSVKLPVSEMVPV